MTHHYFRVVSIMLLVLCVVATSIALFAEEPLKEAAFVVACLFWMSLPLAIYRELFYHRYHSLSRMLQSEHH